jgi:hypothetical protein
MQNVAARLNNWSDEPELPSIVAVASSLTDAAHCA